ncbi:MAG: deoxyribonuclease IV [Candidatus Eremiobacteraeota bacterium]|nr:deoxyribonuclease IV [Candidatus Eremiobacteraeota bacterium]
MFLGLHVAGAAGREGSVTYAARLGCTAMQFFSGNPKTYRLDPLDAPALERCRAARMSAGIERAAIHTSYLINLASEEPKIAKNSLRLLRNDLKVAAVGGIDYVNTHLGSYGTRSREQGFAAVVALLEDALTNIAPGIILVLENSAGAGQLCGGTLEELGSFVRTVGHPQLGICLDTAHSWAAGYAIDSDAGVDRFVTLAEETIGLERVKMFHFNDTQVPLGGNRDRHWHIGDGLIGYGGFRALAAHAALRGKTAILETPGDEADDARNMQTIRLILGGVSPSTSAREHPAAAP